MSEALSAAGEAADSAARGTVDGVLPLVGSGVEPMVCLFLVAAVLAPVLEETVFRVRAPAHACSPPPLPSLLPPPLDSAVCAARSPVIGNPVTLQRYACGRCEALRGAADSPGRVPA